VGAILVKNRQILTTGYNGRPRGLKHCSDTGCLREKLSIESGKNHELCQGLHAEQNAIIQAAVHGISIKDSTIYCTTFPCSICMKMIVNAGINQVYYVEGYGDDLSKDLMKEAGLQVIQVEYHQGDKVL